jgi:hypothetical protein
MVGKRGTILYLILRNFFTIDLTISEVCWWCHLMLVQYANFVCIFTMCNHRHSWLVVMSDGATLQLLTNYSVACTASSAVLRLYMSCTTATLTVTTATILHHTQYRTRFISCKTFMLFAPFQFSASSTMPMFICINLYIKKICRANFSHSNIFPYCLLEALPSAHLLSF